MMISGVGMVGIGLGGVVDVAVVVVVEEGGKNKSGLV